MVEAVRPATSTDLPELVRLFEADRAERAGERGADLFRREHGRQGPLGASIEADLADESGLVLVATIDDVVTGAAVARAGSLADGARLARIVDLYVEPEARSVGLGELLVEAVVAWADAHGCMGVDAVVLPGARGAKNLFERLGFTARSITVHRRARP